MRKVRFFPFCLLIIASLVAGCSDLGTLPIESDNPAIIYNRTGGFWGVPERVSIAPSGIASLESLYPALKLQLTVAERESLLNLLNGFDRYSSSYPSPGFDFFHYTITLFANGRSKSVEIDQLALFGNAELALLTKFIRDIEHLVVRIYDEKSSWAGLSYQFTLDRPVYRPGDTIRAICRVSNQTGLERILFFRNNYRMWFGFASESYSPHLQCWIPDARTAWGDTSSPSQVVVAPSQQVELYFAWNQSFVNYDGTSYSRLLSGRYSASLYLLAGPGPNGAYPSYSEIPFEVAN